MYNLGIIAKVDANSGDVTYRWVLTRRVGKKVTRIASGSHGYGRKQDAIRAFNDLSKIFDGTLMYTKNY